MSVYFIIYYFIHLIAVFLSTCAFLSLCVAFVVLALVFLPGLYSAPIGRPFLRSLLRSVLFLVYVFAFCLFLLFVLVFVFLFLVDLFLFLSLLCPVLATMSFSLLANFLSVVFCLLSCPDFFFFFFSEIVPGLI